MNQVVNLEAAFDAIAQHWHPSIIAQVNDTHVKLAKLEGEFVWHKHDEQDEMFVVLEGSLVIKLRDRELRIGKGECVVIPRGVEHLPIAESEVHVMLIEPVGTLPTGDAGNARTRTDREST